MPNFMAMTSHSVVLASYSATSGLPLMMNVAFSFDTADGSSGGAAIAETGDWPCIAVRATPDPAAFRKFLRENLIMPPAKRKRDSAQPQKLGLTRPHPPDF